jgi:ribonuclease E
MPNKMLIDATHPEETRVVVLRGNRVEEFDFESASRKQLRGNIYLAKVTRVEPSLQAAFIDYGGNRHGFLAFGEIHPDYYQIPIADRQALIAEEEREQRAADAEAEQRAGRRNARRSHASRRREAVRSEPVETESEMGAMAALSEEMAPAAGPGEGLTADAAEPLEAAPRGEETPPASASAETETGEPREAADARKPDADPADADAAAAVDDAHADAAVAAADTSEPVEPGDAAPPSEDAVATDAVALAAALERDEQEPAEAEGVDNIIEVNGNGGDEEVVESVGGADALEEVPERTPRLRRQYKIQEVIKRRQVMLVQVVKEERGTKGAALTTYLSLAGRYSVLMPNTARGGGISRKITSAEDRRRLKEIAQDLDVPEGMGVILRTAGAARTKTEVQRDFEYLLRMWETVRDLTLKSTAPTLVYEEGSLVKRAIRDLYNKDIDEVLVAGEEAHAEARDFMRMLMPSHARGVKLYRDSLPIFTRYGIESQLDGMFTPVVQLRSGGYIVLNQTEALVSIDVNSGRATREHHIEDTALKTNMEAAEEIARQLRLRDLAGLVVIDFIDMDEKRNNRSVERRLKECLRHDRARIQVGHISHFGLLEMSRQRIRSSVLESSTEKCPQCGGSGHVRSVSSVALQLLRSLEETLLKGATHNLTIRARTEIALYLLNQKRAHLRALEERFRITIMVSAEAVVAGQFLIERNEQVHTPEQAKAIAAQHASLAPVEEAQPAEPEAGDEEEVQAEEAAEAAGGEEEAEQGARKRRRRRRGRRAGEAREAAGPSTEPFADSEAALAEEAESGGEAELEEGAGAASTNGEAERRRRRRGRRGGRRNRRERDVEPSLPDSEAQPEPEVQHAVADLNGGGRAIAPPPAHEQAGAVEAAIEDSRGHAPSAQEPAAAAATPVVAPAMDEPPRRRSTVREPLPTSFESIPATPVRMVEPPAAAPVPADESESGAQPRRSGWWSRRLLGKG